MIETRGKTGTSCRTYALYLDALIVRSKAHEKGVCAAERYLT